jgi:hypothetical protein
VKRPTGEEVLEMLEDSENCTTLFMQSNVGSVSAKVRVKDGKLIATFCASRLQQAKDGRAYSVGREDIPTLKEAIDHMLGGWS